MGGARVDRTSAISPSLSMWSLLLSNKSDPSPEGIVTCDEKRISYDNRRRSSQWLDHNEAPKHFPKPTLHQRKVSAWWLAAGLSSQFHVPDGANTAEKYYEELNKMHQKLHQIYPAWMGGGVILHHDNARLHVALVITKG